MIAGQFLPWLVKVGNAAFRKFAAKYIPWKEWQNLVGIVDVMDHTSRHVFDSKKRALEMGDEAILKQVGEGKDILSVLRTCSLLCREAWPDDSVCCTSESKSGCRGGGSSSRVRIAISNEVKFRPAMKF